MFRFQALVLVVLGTVSAEICPTWTFPKDPNNTQDCVCGNSLGQIVKCDYLTRNVSLLKGYCMTYDNETGQEYVASCPYQIEGNYKVLIPLPQNPLELNHFMCSPFNRRNVVCSKCLPGYGPSVFTHDLRCFKCSGYYCGWSLYIFFELFPVTVFFAILTIFHVRMTASAANCILFVMQMVSAILGYGTSVDFYPFGRASEIIRKILLTLYGAWNLDFFRKVVPPFCVSEEMNGIGAISFQYLVVLYLLALTISIFVVLEMHYCGCKLTMWLWKHIFAKLIRVRQYWTSRTFLVDSLATLLLLSYTRLMLISFSLIYPGSIYNEHGVVVKNTLHYQGDMKYFGKEHLPFALLAIVVLLMLVLIPLLVFVVYPRSQKCCRIMRRNQLLVELFIKLFQGCFKDGTNGTRDYRWFSVFYFMLRFLMFITHILGYNGKPHMSYLLPGLVLLMASLTVLLLKPYKESIYNSVDGILLAFAGVMNIFQTIMILIPDTMTGRILQIVVEIGFFIPIIGLLFYLGRGCIRLYRARVFRHQAENMEESNSLPYRLQNPEMDVSFAWSEQNLQNS